MLDVNNMKISITGDLGSGKSSVCNIIKEKYGYDIYYTGKIQREIAERYNMTTLELNKYSETHPEIDKEIDGALVEVGKRKGKLLLDSRMAWHFVPGSFKVFLKVDIDVSAARVMKNQKERGRVEQYKCHEEARSQIMLRKKSENKRYLEKYGVDCYELSNFDLVIDTSYCGAEIIADVIMQNMEKWARGESYNKLWLSSRFIFPTERINCEELSIKKNEAASNAEKPETSYSNTQEDNYIQDKLPLSQVLESNNVFFIYKDHAIVSNHLMKKMDLIPVEVVADDIETLPSGLNAAEYTKLNCKMEDIKAWEECHGFRFPKYPEL